MIVEIPLRSGGVRRVETNGFQFHSILPVTEKEKGLSVRQYTGRDFETDTVIGCDIHLPSGGVIESSMSRDEVSRLLGLV